ncbi:MAG TPA: hypothetical protein VKS60_21915 [Stellaceae bacterium]|nr:hypothetical protein [Stellaceae bacterium]
MPPDPDPDHQIVDVAQLLDVIAAITGDRRAAAAASAYRAPLSSSDAAPKPGTAPAGRHHVDDAAALDRMQLYRETGRARSDREAAAMTADDDEVAAHNRPAVIDRRRRKYRQQRGTKCDPAISSQVSPPGAR